MMTSGSNTRERTGDIPRPSHGQLRWQREHAVGLFVHFGINTFYGLEWSDGSLDPAGFAPSRLDCDQWVSVAKSFGASHIIVTAKHHDGFCLWPTATTSYSVTAAAWRGGQGDVVAELAAACRRGDLGLGLYLSPWDRHDPDWARNPSAYDARYVEQLTELCTRYGPLMEVWFDGAGSEHHAYQWPAIMTVVRRHQPEAMIFNMGEPTIRWVGNEDGLAHDPCVYAVDAVGKSVYHDDLDRLGETRYLPPECDVPIRANWFWQPDDAETLKSLEHLMTIWYRSVGLGAGLLLNAGANREGVIDALDADRLAEFGRELRCRFGTPITSTLRYVSGVTLATFDRRIDIDDLMMMEHLEQGQRIFRHRVIDDETGEVLVSNGLTVGVRRVHRVSRRAVKRLRVEHDPDGRLDAMIGFCVGPSGKD